MPIYKMQCAFTLDSLLPRDELVITPHFDDHGVGTDPQNLTDDLAAGLSAWWAVAGRVEVTAYEVGGPPPHYPMAQTVVNPTGAPASNCPREVAVCLSYFATNNVPRRRGRLFIPHPVISTGTAGTTPDVRPNAATRNKVGELVPVLTGLGGVDVDWSVYSRVDGQARPVSDWWVDDEWDTIRSRGLRSTTRLAGSVSE